MRSVFPVEEEIIPIQVDHYGQDTHTEKTPPPYRVDTGVKSSESPWLS